LNETIYIIAIFLISSQLFFTVLILKNAKYVLKKLDIDGNAFTPKTLLTIPCKGLDIGFDFEENIKSFFFLDYPDYCINFVVESPSDEAYALLRSLKQRFGQACSAKEVKVLVAGLAATGGQKNHNLLHSLTNSGGGFTIFAFADSDARVNSNWLTHLVYPLQQEKAGASSGYRWIVPVRNNFSTLLLSALNAKVTQFLGKSFWNQAWGGSMAIRRDTFYSLGLNEIWKNCISDDLSLTYAVKKKGLKIRFSLGALAATYEQTSFAGLFEFARRQFLITRKTLPLVWLLGLISCLYSVCGVWATFAAGLYHLGSNPLPAITLLFTSVVFICSQIIRSLTRQKIAASRLNIPKATVNKAASFDYTASAIGSVFMLLFMLSAAFGSQIRWRGKRYKITNAAKTILLD